MVTQNDGLDMLDAAWEEAEGSGAPGLWINGTDGARIAWVGRSSRSCDNNQWIACLVVRDMVEGDDLGARRGLFESRRDAIDALFASRRKSS